MKFWQGIGHLARKWVAETITGRWRFEPEDGGNGLEVNQNNDHNAFQIANSGEEEGFLLLQNKVMKAGTQSFKVYSNQVETNTTQMNKFHIDNASSTAHVLKLENDGSGNGLFIDQNGNASALSIDSEATNTAALAIDQALADTNASINVKHGGTAKFTIFRNDAVNENATVRIGSYFFWVDGSGKFRIHSSQPTSDTDGTVVGTQT